MVRPQPKKRMLIYARISTNEDKQEHSIEAQVEKCKLKCQLHDYDIVDIITDTHSGLKLKARPGIMRAIEMLRNDQADGIVVWKLERLSRSVEHTQYFFNKVFRKGKHFVSATEHYDTTTAVGRLIVNLVSSVNQFSSENTGENVSMVMQNLRKQKKVYCAKVYGWDKKKVGSKKDGTAECILVENEAEQRGLKRMMALYTAGQSYEQIAKTLSRERYLTARGRKHWTGDTVRKIIMRHEKEKIEALVPQPETEGDADVYHGVKEVPNG